MACFHPQVAWQLDDGTVVFKQAGKVRRELKLPCGGCVGCRLERSRTWMIRVMNEASMHEHNAFVTLTYKPEALPPWGNLNYRDFQLFMKRLRKQFGPVRFYMCGEYGEKDRRPHYHACLFGVNFVDRKVWGKNKNGDALYRSFALEQLWPHGISTFGNVTEQSASYVSRYIMKKVTGDAARDHYMVVNDDGETFDLTPEFTRMSLKPGIGAEWIKKYVKDVKVKDSVIIKGRSMRPPRYYDKFIEEEDYDHSEHVNLLRYEKSKEYRDDNTRERLEVREKVALGSIKHKVRDL
jgi:hypothetical protein